MGVRIRPLDEASSGAWDAFVRATPEAGFFHLSGWERVIRDAFGHTTHYAFAEQDGAIVGVLVGFDEIGNAIQDGLKLVEFRDVGVDLGSTVSLDYMERRPFRFDGRIARVDVRLN